MAGLEDMMAGLFGGNEAAGLDEMRRRRTAPGAGGGYEGIGGASVLPGMMQQYYGGLPGYDFSGAMGAQMGGRQGLMGLLGGRDLKGPALRHFQNQGFDFNPPGQDNREQPGGPNIAPGNIDDAKALFQSMGNETPGVPQGVAVGQAPGQMRPMPRTQGWRNLAEGYSAAAQFGSGGPQDQLRGFGGARPPAAQQAPPGGRPVGGGGGGGGAPQSQNPVGGGGAPVRPGAGGGGQGTSGGGPSGGKNTGGGQAPTGVTPQVKQQAAQQSTARGGATGGVQTTAPVDRGPGGKPKINPKTGGVTSQGQGILQGPTANGPSTQVAVPNNGNNNTPSETGGQTGKLAGLSPKEKAARKAAWEAKVAAKQEKQRLKAAPSASQFGKDPRGTGLEPLPQAGKTKPKPKPGVGGLTGKRS